MEEFDDVDFRPTDLEFRLTGDVDFCPTDADLDERFRLFKVMRGLLDGERDLLLLNIHNQVEKKTILNYPMLLLKKL